MKVQKIILFSSVLSIFIFCSLFLHTQHKARTRQTFQAFTNAIFLQEVQRDSISLHYTLANPAAFQITKDPLSFGHYGLKEMRQQQVYAENGLKKLHSFPFSLLSHEQQETYEILQYHYQEIKKSAPFSLYEEPLSKSLGIQAQLPILLCEYPFRSKHDVQNYLLLLQDLPSYFNELLTYEKHKARANVFMNDFALQDVIAQCNALLAHKKHSFFSQTFSNRLSYVPDIKKQEVQQLQQKHDELLSQFVFPAYRSLVKQLRSLAPFCRNVNGLCHLPKGKAYYRYLAAMQTSCTLSVEQMRTLLTADLKRNREQIKRICTFHPDILPIISSMQYPLTDPNKILAYLQKKMQKDFPTLSHVNCTIKYVSKALQPYLSPAFYLTPALDSAQENQIYINPNPAYDLSQIFPTIAHEGYPGHLYQCVFFQQQQKDPIRYVLHFGGYSEGWATYVELQSYHWAGFSPLIATLLEKNNICSLEVYALADIGIHFDGWSLKKTNTFLKSFFSISDPAAIEMFYHTIIEEPANYLKYAVGYLSFQQLRKKAENALQAQFVPKKFHTFLLKMGPAPFPLIEKAFHSFIK